MRALIPVVVATLASGAGANTPDLFGVGSRATAMGGAFTAVADDFSAVWYNPAGITQQRRASLVIAPILGAPDIWIEDTGSERRDLGLPAASGVWIGLAGPIGRLFGVEDLSFGLALYSPADYVLQTEIPARSDARYLPMWSDGYRRMSVAVALAYRLPKGVSLGIGLDVLMDLGGGSVLALRSPENAWDERARLGVDIRREITLDPSLLAGLHVALSDTASVGISYRGQARAETTLVPNTFSLGSIDLDMELSYTSFFRPHQLTFGLMFRPHERLLISVDLGWQGWSAYVGPHTETPDPGFDDVLIPRLGAELRIHEALRVSAGWFWHQSPVRDQSGVSSFTDHHRHGLSAGTEWDLRAWIPVTLAAHVQGQLLQRRETVKDPALLGDADPDLPGKQIENEGYPSFASGGWVTQGGLTVTLWL